MKAGVVCAAFLATASFARDSARDPVRDLASTVTRQVTGRIASLAEAASSVEFTAWLELQRTYCASGIYQNLGSWGANARDADPGAVIASPSKQSPDYYYQWTRDSAIAADTLLEVHLQRQDEADEQFQLGLTRFFVDYMTETSKLQALDTPSGPAYAAGLGEPKFHVDGTVFEAPWGRPQHDGPALRAIALAKFADLLLQEDVPVPLELYRTDPDGHSVVKDDLNYVAGFWNTSGFDPWEEVYGTHYFTLAVSLKALSEGSLLAARMNDMDSARRWSRAASDVDAAMPAFYDVEKGFVRSALGSERLDASVLLASLYGASSFTPWSSEILSTLMRLNEQMGQLYPVNAAVSGSRRGVLLGRYPEDVYDGVGRSQGNPWFVTTAAAAQVLYETAAQLEHNPDTLQSISPQVLEYFTGLPAGEATLGSVLPRLVQFADGFLRAIQSFVGLDGTMSEQIDRSCGYQRGAQKLTWSYVALLSAIDARECVASLASLPPPDLIKRNSGMCDNGDVSRQSKTSGVAKGSMLGTEARPKHQAGLESKLGHVDDVDGHVAGSEPARLQPGFSAAQWPGAETKTYDQGKQAYIVSASEFPQAASAAKPHKSAALAGSMCLVSLAALMMT